jgi:hypothetical protein
MTLDIGNAIQITKRNHRPPTKTTGNRKDKKKRVPGSIAATDYSGVVAEAIYTKISPFLKV